MLPDLEKFLTDLQTMPPASLQTAAFVSIIAGAVYCLGGYRIIKFLIVVTGFVLAGAVGAGFGYALGGSEVFAIVGGIGGGIAGAAALLFVYKAGVFCLGLLGGLIAGNAVVSGYDATWAPWAVLGAAVGGGLVALLIERPVLIVATAALGAWFVVSGLAYFVIGQEILEAARSPELLGDKRWIVVGCWAVLVFTGIVMQWRATRKRIVAPAEEG